ncbi:MAG: DNA adenine methylase [Acidimicrobiales bacterium]
MKYMGSKRWMLSNGLGHLLVKQAESSERFIDLFSGTGAVSWHVAEHTDLPVLAVDLQMYSAVLARSVIGRTQSVNGDRIAEEWIGKATEIRLQNKMWQEACRFDPELIKAEDVLAARRLCSKSNGLVTAAYGGHYFSPKQAISTDALIQALPEREPKRSVCLATLIWSLTRCVASPGHTAQPFQPTASALPFIRDSWSRDVFSACLDVIPDIANRSAGSRGSAIAGDATIVAAKEARPGDLVFLDPPYSAAQYSRFYHVLETVARGSCGPVSGGGRYPPAAERPRSSFSLLSQANQALRELLSVLGKSGCRVVMTFPQHGCSNGISGEDIINVAREWFEVDVTSVRIRHSTLGGNNAGRAARRSAMELILSMQPRRPRY